MTQNIFTEQQSKTAENLHQGAISLLDIKDTIEEGDFETADRMLAKIEDAISFTRVAVQGLQLISEAEDI